MVQLHPQKLLLSKMEWWSLRQQAPYLPHGPKIPVQECCSRASWAWEGGIVNRKVPFKPEASDCYSFQVKDCENLFFSHSVKKKKMLSAYSGPVLFKCFIWMSSCLWKRDCYPQFTVEEIVFKQWCQYLNPGSLLHRMYSPLP